MSIVIVNWNAAAVLPACLKSIASQTGIDLRQVIVVDNASTDNSLTEIQEIQAHSQLPLTVIENDANVGYGAANNHGARLVDADTIIFLNPDTEFTAADCVMNLCAPLRDPAIGLVGPRLLNPDGSPQRSCEAFPNISSTLILATGLHRCIPDTLKQRWVPGESSQSESTYTGWVGGACIALPLHIFWAVGGFSEATFMYGEDLELAYCVHRAGYRILYTVSAEVIHHNDHSADQRWSSPERAARVAQGERVFLRRHYGLLHRTVINALRLGAYFARWIVLASFGDGRASVYRAMALSLLKRG